MFLSGSSPKSNPADNLDEVVVTAKRIEPAEDIPEIVVSARRIPWYAWAILGGVAFVVVDSIARKR